MGLSIGAEDGRGGLEEGRVDAQPVLGWADDEDDIAVVGDIDY